MGGGGFGLADYLLACLVTLLYSMARTNDLTSHAIEIFFACDIIVDGLTYLFIYSYDTGTVL